MIRIATLADCSAMEQLHGTAFERGWTEQEIASLIRQNGVTASVYEVNGVCAGFTLLRNVADEAEILTLVTAKDCQRRGIGSALVTHMLHHAVQAGASVLFLEVAEDNAAACALYAQCGFTVDGRRKAYYQRTNAPAADAILMRCVLIAP